MDLYPVILQLVYQLPNLTQHYRNKNDGKTTQTTNPITHNSSIDWIAKHSNTHSRLR